MNPQKKIQRRQIDGVLLLDKPLGLSSNDALVRAKRLFNARKAGHTGTLDPLATGLLPLCFGEATKFSQDLLEADKTYESTLKLGERTASGDAEGEVVASRPVECDERAVAEVLAQFRGEIRQVPPMYSALKRDGKPLYEYARAGETLEREARAVTIHSLELIGCALPYVTIRVTCSKGTYVRTLGEDIGEALGCGAHLTMLRRTGVGALTLDHAVTLEQLDALAPEGRDALLAPVDALLGSFEAITLDEDQTRRFLHGQRLRISDRAAGEPARVRIYSPDARLLGTAQLHDGVLAPERLIASA
ncbi:tRNA pseudouridine(55) synthase TruB [Pararobbsia alpina]|uniref:tRNA pseudouridine synthase B n=1 Tax=Pararobbsia alpina TaxID=621374 RepID=A0A6S7BAZ7_9BURK|nr:tRNA pseudouridine(55) synthase TruB [Pararobbsia alpina]CAB3784916.1 tRNA pseudouridine synthase B [Pararobbsia alpina]